MSSGVARRILAKRGWPTGVESESGRPVGAEGAGVGGGGGAAAAILVEMEMEMEMGGSREMGNDWRKEKVGAWG
jgi:hypothetical protein